MRVETRTYKSELRAEESVFLVGRAASYNVTSHDLGVENAWPPVVLMTSWHPGDPDCLHTVDTINRKFSDEQRRRRTQLRSDLAHY